jgi:hypothetical protein
MKNRYRFLIGLVAVLVSLTSCQDSAWEKHIGGNAADATLMELISSRPDLSVFAHLLQKTGYDDVLHGAGSYTVFAPGNASWSGVDTTDATVLAHMLGMLIVHNTYYSDNQQLYLAVSSVNGKKIFYDAAAKSFNGATILQADVAAANGVMHVTDQLVERRENIWDYLATLTVSEQFKYINLLNTRVMDMEKSVPTGVYSDGRTRYDTAWMNKNQFLDFYPLDKEDSVFTYVIVDNTAFDALYAKYQPYFKGSTAEMSDSVTRFNVTSDYVFRGIVDIAAADTLVNVNGVKVPIGSANIKKVYSASNGRVYHVDQCDIRLKDKIKPVKIEGENYNTAFDRNFVFTRYKRWASGERDVVLSSGATQSDTLWRKVPLPPDTVPQRDSIATKTYFINSGLVANVANFFIEYKVPVNSAAYDVYYVAYDDINDHYDHSYRNFGVYRVEQKLFASMPGAPVLRHGTADNTRGVANNYLGEQRCFVGQTLAGVHELTKLRMWNLEPGTQLLSAPLLNPEAEVMAVPRAGVMTLWLTNTARSNASSRQGLLFLDYILLVPRIDEE